MADEPSNGELGRRLDNITVMVANLVGTREFGEFQRYVTHLLGELTKDIADERAAREEAVKAEREAREKGFGEIRTEQSSVRSTNRMAILTGIGTLLGGIALAALTHWTSLGGH